MSKADGYVLPKPGVPKTFGILNVIFGVMLVLYGLCQVGGALMAPAMMQMVEKASKEAQAKTETAQKAQLKEFDDKAAAAKTDEEKKEIEAEKARAIANTPPVPKVDMAALTGPMTNPTIMGFSITQSGTGVLMSIGLIVAGIGLIRLKSWGRKLSLWLAGIQIVRLAILTAVSIIVVQPVSMQETNKMFAKLEADAKAPGAPPNAAGSMEVSKTMAAMGSIGAIAYFVFGSIYPVISLIMLSSAGARAACQARKPEVLPDI